MWRYVVGRVVPGVSTVHRVFICRIKLSSEVEGTTFLRNVRRYSPNYTAFHPCADLTLEPSDSIKQRVIFLLSGEPLASDEGLFSLKLFSEMFVYLFLLIHSLFLVYLTKLLVTQTIQRWTNRSTGLSLHSSHALWCSFATLSKLHICASLCISVRFSAYDSSRTADQIFHEASYWGVLRKFIDIPGSIKVW